MEDSRKITFAVTNYNRYEMLFRSFSKILDDDRVGEICIVDDNSHPEVWSKLSDRVDSTNHPKIKMYRNHENLGVYRNKHRAVSLSSFEWVLVADSDNIYGVDYLDRVFEKIWDKDVIFNPVYALPVFKFDEFSGIMLTKENVASYSNLRWFETGLNLMNYFCNRDSYLEVWDASHEPIGSDSIYQNYNWLRSGKKIYFMPNLTYEHTVHSGSHYVQNAAVSTPMVFDVVEKLKLLK